MGSPIHVLVIAAIAMAFVQAAPAAVSSEYVDAQVCARCHTQIAVDYARDLIVCNCISPGKIVTGAEGLAKDPARLAYQRQRTPWPRFGRPQDVANAATFLASDRASFITGSNLVIDGGWLAG